MNYGIVIGFTLILAAAMIQYSPEEGKTIGVDCISLQYEVVK